MATEIEKVTHKDLLKTASRGTNHECFLRMALDQLRSRKRQLEAEKLLRIKFAEMSITVEHAAARPKYS